MKEYFLSVFRKNPHEIPTLNGIRGIAFFMVIYVHTYRPYRYFGIEGANVYIENFLNNGSLCMDAFFVLSGFLIGGQLLAELNKTGQVNYSQFLTKRVLRIFPPYYIFLGLQYLFLKAAVQSSNDPNLMAELPKLTEKLVWDFAYLSDYIPGSMVHGWSLSVEEKFYLLLPFLLVFLFRFGSKILILGSMLSLFFLPIVLRSIGFFQLNADEYNYSSYVQFSYYPFHSRMDSLFFGVFLAGIKLYYPELIESYLRSFWSSLAVFGCFVTLFCIMIFTNEESPGLFTYVFRFTLAAVAWSALLLKAFDPKSFTAKFFSFQGFAPVAKLSYCAYIIHLLLLGALSKKFIGYQKIHYSEIFIWTIPFGLMILCYAYIYFLLTERPFLVLRRYFLKEGNR